MVLTHQLDTTFVERQLVEPGAKLRGEGFESLELAPELEHLRQHGQRGGSREHTSSPNRALLARTQMRSAVGTKKELGITADGRVDDRLTVLVRLGHWHAERMRPNPLTHHIVEGVDRVMRGDSRRQVGRPMLHRFDGRLATDMLPDDTKRGIVSSQLKHLIHAGGLAVEDECARLLGMHAEHHAKFSHLLEHALVDVAQIRHSVVRVGRPMLGVDLAGHHTDRHRLLDGRRLRVRIDLDGHEWLKRIRHGQRVVLADLRLVQHRFMRPENRLRTQIRHDQCPRKMRPRVGQHLGQHVPATQVHMPVIGTTNIEFRDHVFLL